MAKGYIAGIPGTGGGGGGTGDMEKAVYDTNSNNIVDKVDTVPTATYTDDEMLKYDQTTDKVVGTGDTNTDLQVDFGSKDLRCKTVITESASVDIGPGVTLSDRGGFVVSTSNVTGNQYINMDYKIDDTGTSQPLYYSRGQKVVREVVQPDDSQQMLNVTSYTVTPPVDQDVLRVYLKLINPVTNYRERVISVVTGEVVKYFPSRNDWENGTGVSLSAGEQFIDFDSPLAEGLGFPLTVEVVADQSIDVLGNGVNPWRAVDSQDITNETVSTYIDKISETSLSEKSTRPSSGLILSADGDLGVATTFSVTSGEMELYDTPFVSDAESAHTVSVAALTNATPTYALPQLNWIVSSGLTGLVEMRITPPNPQQRRYESVLGVVSYDGAVITSAIQIKQNYNQVGNQLIDFMTAVGNLVTSGLKVSPATAGGLAIQVDQGTVFGSNINFTSEYNPHVKGYPSLDPANDMTRYLGDGTTQSAGVALIDPANYNPAGGNTYEAMPGGVNSAQIIQIYLRVDTGGIVYLPGQVSYTNIASAIEEFSDYRPLLPQVVSIGSVKLGSIIVRKGATDLSLIGDAVFVPTTKFGDVQPLAGPASDIEPTPLPGNRVAYNGTTGKLQDTGEFAPISLIAGTPFTVPEGVIRARYLVGVAGADTIINLPDGIAGMEYEFINNGTWGDGGFFPKVELFETPFTYSYQLDTSNQLSVHPFESYTFFHNGIQWGVYYNG